MCLSLYLATSNDLLISSNKHKKHNKPLNSNLHHTVPSQASPKGLALIKVELKVEAGLSRPRFPAPDFQDIIICQSSHPPPLRRLLVLIMDAWGERASGQILVGCVGRGIRTPSPPRLTRNC